MSRLSLGLLVAVAAGSPDVALAHDAFGDLGPFYGALLHPLADPAQGLILAGIAVVLARQPLATVRLAWLALALSGAVTVLSGAWVELAGPGPGVASLAGVVLGLLALSGRDLGRWLSIGLAALAGIVAGLAIDLPTGARAASLGAFGGAVGIGLAALLVWGLVDGLQHRFGRVAGAVAASWVAAVGTMAAAFSFAGAA